MNPGTLPARPTVAAIRATILLVEDEALIAMAETMTLEREGYRVVSARTGEEAVELAGGEQNIDLILMDINLGAGIDGTQAAMMILQERELPIVFLSSYTDKETVERAEQISAYGYVVKTTGKSVLAASVERALGLFESGRSE